MNNTTIPIDPYRSFLQSVCDTIPSKFSAPDEVEEWIQNEMDSKQTHIIYCDRFELKPSKIHGVGCFAKKDFASDESLGLAYTPSGARTELARFVNHKCLTGTPPAVSISELPARANAYVVSGTTIKASRYIMMGEEITLNYNMQLRFFEMLGLLPAEF